jgi:hypothetical protein
MDPTRKIFHQLVGLCAVSNGGMLGGNLIVVAGSVRWTGNLPDRADMVARGGVEAVHGQNGNNFEPRVEVPIKLCSIALDSSGLDLLIGTITEAIGGINCGGT